MHSALWSEALSNDIFLFLVRHLKVVSRKCCRKDLCLTSNSELSQHVTMIHLSQLVWQLMLRWSICTNTQPNKQLLEDNIHWQNTSIYSHHIKKGITQPMFSQPAPGLLLVLQWEHTNSWLEIHQTPALLSHTQYSNTPCTFVRQASLLYNMYRHKRGFFHAMRVPKITNWWRETEKKHLPKISDTQLGLEKHLMSGTMKCWPVFLRNARR